MSDVLHALFFVSAFGMIFITIIALEAGYVHWTQQQGIYHFKETLANLSAGFCYKAVDGIAIALFIQTFYNWVASFGLQWYPQASGLSITALILLVDFFFYLDHYLMHKTRWLWASHVTHHSSKHMNFSTALRQNFTHALNGAWILWWIPAALIGFDKDWVLLAIEGNLVYQFFLHTEQVKKLGWIEKLFNTPSHHRVHHGRNPKQIDTNFGGILIIWDKLFGTFQPEETAGDVVYGIPNMPEKPYNPIYLQLHEWHNIWADLKRYRDPRILYKAPDWVERHYGSETSHQTNIKDLSC